MLTGSDRRTGEESWAGKTLLITLTGNNYGPLSPSEILLHHSKVLTHNYLKIRHKLMVLVYIGFGCPLMNLMASMLIFIGEM